MARIKRDIITGTWRETKKNLVATWRTSNDRITGFYVQREGLGGIGRDPDIFIDKNKNGTFERGRDKRVGTLSGIGQSLWEANSGSWILGVEPARVATISDAFSKPIALAYFTDLSFF